MLFVSGNFIAAFLMIIKLRYILLILLTSFCCCKTSKSKNLNRNSVTLQVLKLEMFLDAFGVEADGFPTINAKIDFVSDSGICMVSYYEPWLKQKQYSFSKAQIDTIRSLLINNDFKKIKKDYSENASDQPTSSTTIYTIQDTFRIKDYGLIAEFPLTELYRIVYDFKKNFR